ncbi:MAG: tyrosine-protein phosphatase [Chitinophagaceae bacterium]
MFSFFAKKYDNNLNLSFLEVDMHSHLLPNLDDGLETIEQTITFAKEMQHLGYKKLICTPHILPDVHDNSPETILPRLEEVRKAFKENDIDIEIDAAAEYMVGPEFHQSILKGDQLLTFGKNYILIEMSYAAPSQNIAEVIFDLKIKGYRPILAHPERYNYYLGNPAVYEDFIGRGCLLQVNLLSLTGFYGKPVQKAAEYLVKNKLISFIGSDMHHKNHLNMTKQIATSTKFHKMAAGLDLKNKTLL